VDPGRTTNVRSVREIQEVIFPAAGGRPLLEGMLHMPDGSGPFPGAVVCHPHPLMGGTMDNAIVVAVCHVLAARGWAALRFNFRGAGASEGHFDEGRGERNDVAGAVTFLRTRAKLDPNQVAIVGYSFGAEVGLRHAARDTQVGWLVGIALVQENYDDPFLDADTRPKLFIVGERDPWAPTEELRAYVARLSPPKTLHILPHTDHFFAGCEAEVATLIGKWVEETPW
jgi:alpha/beta superfamily hydrolase